MQTHESHGTVEAVFVYFVPFNQTNISTYELHLLS